MTKLVLLPGMDGTGLLFTSFTDALVKNVQPVVVAYPPTQALNYAQLEAYAREHMPVDEPFIVLGESFSGPIAISIAASAPPNLVGLILCCSFAKNPRPVLAGLKPLISLLPGLRSGAMASFLLLGHYATPVLRQQLGDALAAVSPEALRARLRAILEVDVMDALRRVEMPVLYLRATHDRLVPETACKLIAGLAPQAGMAIVEGPHMLLQAVPAVAVGIVEKFVAQHPS